jgi:hypothetical protein
MAGFQEARDFIQTARRASTGGHSRDLEGLDNYQSLPLKSRYDKITGRYISKRRFLME